MKLDEFIGSEKQRNLTGFEIGSGGLAPRVREELRKGNTNAIGVDTSFREPYPYYEEAAVLGLLPEQGCDYTWSLRHIFDFRFHMTSRGINKVATMEHPKINPDLVVKATTTEVLEVLDVGQLEIIWLDYALQHMFVPNRERSESEQCEEVEGLMKEFLAEVDRVLADDGRVIITDYILPERGFLVDHAKIFKRHGFVSCPNEKRKHRLETPSDTINRIYDGASLNAPLTVLRKD